MNEMESHLPMEDKLKIKDLVQKDDPYCIEVEGVQFRRTISDWAVEIEAIFSITGRGIVLSGSVLYGKPWHGDSCYIPKTLYNVQCRGVDMFSISCAWWPSANVGILINDIVMLPDLKHTKVLKSELSEHPYYLPGKVIYGSKVPWVDYSHLTPDEIRAERRRLMNEG